MISTSDNTTSQLGLPNELVKHFALLFRGRTDAWGSIEGRCNKQSVTLDHYQRHLNGKVSLGVYPLRQDGQCCWFGIDIDHNDIYEAMAVIEQLHTLGFNHGIYVERSKIKGFHIFGLLSNWVPAREVRRIVLHTIQKAGLPASTEVFPKQDAADKIRYGNYLNLPYFGGGDMKGRRMILDLQSFEPIPLAEFLATVQRFPVDALPLVLEGLPQEKRKSYSRPLLGIDGKSPNWVAKALEGVPEGRRHETMKQLTGHFLARGLPPGEVTAILAAWNNRNTPPLPQNELTFQVSDMVHRWAPTSLTYTQLEDLYNKWLLIEDKSGLKLTLAVVVSHLLSGDPVWLFLIAPPSGTKTEIILSLSSLPFVHYLPDVNARTFASGEKGANDVSLLANLKEGLLTVKDFTTVLAKRWEERQEILSQLREIYDGKFEKRWGSGKHLKWEGRLSLLAGVTPVIDTHHAVMQVLGERFVQLRLLSPNRTKMAAKAINHVGNEKPMRSELREGVKAFFANLDIPESVSVHPELIARLSTLSDFVTRARSGVVRDSYRRDLLLAPEPEAPARLAKQLFRTLQSLSVIDGREIANQEDYALVYRLALDCIPKIRLQCLELLNNSDELETSKIASGIAYPTSTTRLCLEELNRMGLVNVTKSGKGKADLWSLSDLACQLLEDSAPEVFETKMVLV